MLSILSSAVLSGSHILVVNSQLTTYLQPLIETLIILAGLSASFFIVVAGVEYIISRGNPQRLIRAKKILKNACLGLLLVIAAGFIFNLLNNAYNSSTPVNQTILPATIEMQTTPDDNTAGSIITTASDILRYIINTVFEPFMGLVQYLSLQTPLLGNNPTVSKLWLIILGIANSLFILITILLGFRLMSATTFGFNQLSFKQLLPKLGLTFLVMNISLFLIDTLISISNAVVNSLWSAASVADFWQVWQILGSNSEVTGFIPLLLMTVNLVLSLLLILYYVFRLVIVYLGAVLAPLVILLQLLPLTKGFTLTAMKTYVYTIFILFIHSLILILASSLITSLANHQAGYQELLTLIIGMATFTLMLKAPKTVSKWCQVDYSFKSLKHSSTQASNELVQAIEQVRIKNLTNV